jgi:hypothetical protein
MKLFTSLFAGKPEVYGFRSPFDSAANYVSAALVAADARVPEALLAADFSKFRTDGRQTLEVRDRR